MLGKKRKVFLYLPGSSSWPKHETRAGGNHIQLLTRGNPCRHEIPKIIRDNDVTLNRREGGWDFSGKEGSSQEDEEHMFDKPVCWATQKPGDTKRNFTKRLCPTPACPPQVILYCSYLRWQPFPWSRSSVYFFLSLLGPDCSQLWHLQPQWHILGHLF